MLVMQLMLRRVTMATLGDLLLLIMGGKDHTMPEVITKSTVRVMADREGL
jgi:hypothetical protein